MRGEMPGKGDRQPVRAMGRKTGLWLLALAGLVLAAGCVRQYQSGLKNRECTRQLFAMDTVMQFTAYGKDSEAAVDAAMKEIQRLDALLSTGSASSEVSVINAAGEGDVSEDTSRILAAALDCYQSTGGLFDFTVYPLMQLWGFPTQRYHVPTDEELSAVLPLVDASKVQFDGNHITLSPGQQIDLGGIAKGYASARVMEIFRGHGVKSGMVTLGGNVQALNVKTDGSKWRIAIRDPQAGSTELAGIVSVENRAVITSGGYERYFEEDGSTYIHILDPRTGYPADRDLLSVTIVSEDGTLADALSTSLYIMGLEDASAYWREHSEQFDMVLITDDKKIYVTEGVADDFETEWESEVLRL